MFVDVLIFENVMSGIEGSEVGMTVNHFSGFSMQDNPHLCMSLTQGASDVAG